MTANLNSKLREIKEISLVLGTLEESKKNKFLCTLGKILLLEEKRIIAANKKDILFAKRMKLSKAFIDRLTVDQQVIDKMILTLENIQILGNPVGKIIEERRLDNGLLLQKLSVPLGVILVIYESRPEVTIDVSALCIKSGNCAILKGGKEALNTNRLMVDCIRRALRAAELPKDSVTFISERNIIASLLKQNKYIDLVIARGGYEMVKRIQDTSKIPVLAHSAGGARIYVDRSADLEMAEKIIINAKISKPAACNSVDTILVHKDIAGKLLPLLTKKLKALNVEVRGDEKACRFCDIKKAQEKDWKTEFLDLIIAVKIVEDTDRAIEFINQYSKHHTEGIIASDTKVIQEFIAAIDSAAIFVNASTRFHDGGVFGMGGEVGISTGKLHARGPVGLAELTTYKWIVEGSGQVRKIDKSTHMRFFVKELKGKI